MSARYHYVQQSPPSNNVKQSVRPALTSTGPTQEGPRVTPHASAGPSRSSQTKPRSTPRSSPRRRIQLRDWRRNECHDDHSIMTPFQNTHYKCKIFKKALRRKLTKITSDTRGRDQEKEATERRSGWGNSGEGIRNGEWFGIWRLL